MRLLTYDELQKLDGAQLLEIARKLGMDYKAQVTIIKDQQVVTNKEEFISMLLRYNDRLVAVQSAELAGRLANRALLFSILSALAALISAAAALYTMLSRVSPSGNIP